MKAVVLEHGIIHESDNTFGYAAWPTVAKMPDGSLAAVYSGNRVDHVCPFGRVLMRKSYDNGKTWGAPVTVIDTDLDDRDGGIVVFGENRDKIMITSFNNTTELQRDYFRHHKAHNLPLVTAFVDRLEGLEDFNERQESVLGSTYVLSEDNGKSFTDVTVLPITAPHGPCVLKDGSLFYVGMAFMSEKGAGYSYGNFKPIENKTPLYYLRSKDGKTWDEPVMIPADIVPEGEDWFFCEPHAIELENGRILVVIRVHKSKDKKEYWRGSYACHSDDGGLTWSTPELIADRGFPPHLVQLKNGLVVCSYGYRYGDQMGQRVRVSADNGDSWSEEMILRGDAVTDDLGYPSTVELDDGTLLTVYYHNVARGKNCGIYYTKWKLEK